MSTSYLSTGAPPLHYLASPENIRSIFYTNLVLLGVHEYSSIFSQKLGSHHHLVETAATAAAAAAHHGFSESRLGTSSSLAAASMTRSVSRPPQLQQTIIIDSCGYDASGNTRPLELHRHVFAKGHQSTKALEFVLWFLFSRLDKDQARGRFKECWPVLDRHDAREFRNVAFKWLEELRKDGCFGVGHQLAKDGSSATLSSNNATNSSNNTSSNAGSLGLFLPTIRRSYLDESIGERIEQLVLVLSTYVLSTIIKKEQRLQEEVDMTMWESISQVPETLQDEMAFLESIDSQIVRRSQSFLRDVEHQKAVRKDWSLKSLEMCSRLNTYSRELMNIESERRMFLVHQPHIADRTGLLSLEELQVLENRWIEKINDQWRPILSFVERHVERKDVLQALLDADSGSGSSVLEGKRLQEDLSMTLGHLANHDGHSGPSADLVSILKIWKRSLQQLERETKQDGSNPEASGAVSQKSLEKLSRSHAQQLEAIKGTRTQLENRLNEVTRRVKRLKREKEIQERPYQRLLSTTIMAESHGSESFATPLLPASKDSRKEAAVTATTVFSALAPSSPDNASPPVHQGDIRNQIRASASQLPKNHPNSHRSLLESNRGQDISDVLLVRAPNVTVTKPSLSRVKPLRTDPFKVPPPFIKSINFKPITYKPTTAKPITPATPSTPAITATVVVNPARLPTKLSSSIIRPHTSFASSRNGLAESRMLQEFSRKRSLAKDPVTKPAPEDLVMRENSSMSRPKAAERKDAIALLTEEPAPTTTPSVATQNSKRPVQPNTKPPPSIAARMSSPNSKRTALWTSLFQTRDLGSKTGTTNHVTVESVKPKDPAHHQPALPTEIVADDTTPDPVQPVHHTQEPAHPPPTTPPPTTPPPRSIFRGRLGVSRKRRQSSDFQPGRSTTPLQQVPDEAHRTLLWEKHTIQPAKADNLFQENDDEPPGTPSKRRRTDSVLGRRASFVYDAEMATKDDAIHQPTKAVSRTPDRSTLLKTLRSPKLTLDDLRAPTPKPIKTKDSESISMPLMLLHTPQQKLLFQMETGQIPKVSNPFTSLTPSSLMDPKGKSSLASPTSSPFKRPAFSTSIFARFKANQGHDRQDTSSSVEHPIQTTPDRSGHWDTSSPFAPSPTVGRTPPPRRPSTPVLIKSTDRKPLTTTSILKHLLNGSSVAFDRMCDKDDNSSVDKKSDPPATTLTATTIPTALTTSAANPSAATKPMIQAPRQEHKEIHPIRRPASKVAEIKKVTPPRTSTTDENAAVVSLGVKQNPWGRPPSWKPEPPKMIDMDNNKHQMERARRLGAKGGFGIAAPLSESLAKSSMGSLKVSVFGRSMHPTATLQSSVPASASYSPLSSVSLRSFRSDSSQPSSLSGPGTATIQGQAMGRDDIEEEEEEDDDPDNDTRGFSPPVVSPIRGSDAERYKSFAASSSSMMMAMMMSTRRQESEKPRFHIASRSAPQRAEPVHADEPLSKMIESTAAVVTMPLDLDQESEAERLEFLDEPMPEFDGEKGVLEGGRLEEVEEDMTVMNYALQPIFGGSGSSQGQGQGGFRRSHSKSMPQIFGNSNSCSSGDTKGAELQSSGARLSHHRHDEHVFRSTSMERSEVVVEARGIDGGGDGEESMMMMGGLFDELMPDGLDPDEVLWENTELFS
ncbi:hypothetical protein BGW39_011947 [Mortierella sp. 14UC]|nr:hypothetical protein BGW39_011947 [Mortierella sp. 14UC]